MKNKRLISLLLLLAVLTSSLAGCSGTEEETESSTTEVQAAETESVAETEPETVNYLDDLPTVDYNGADFRISGSNEIDGDTNPLTLNMSCGEMTGEIVNDTLYERDAWLTEKYNVKINNIVDHLSREQYQRIAQAGDNEFDFFWADIGWTGYYLAFEGCTHAMNHVDNLHLDQPYWDQNTIQDMSYGDTVLFVTGPITPTFYACTYLLMFNRDIATNMDLPDLYEIVENGTWTLDKMFEVADMADIDLNGDGEMTDDDQFGLMYSTTILDTVLLGSGLRYLTWDGESMVSNFGNEKLVNLMDKLLTKLQHESVRSMDVDPFDADKVLNNGTTLFYNPTSKEIASFRELEYDFGILPGPKENEEQAEYFTYGQPWSITCPYILVTNTGEQLAMTGMILDAMAAYGYHNITPAAYDNVVRLKSTRDEKSYEIIDLIFQNIVFDIGTISSTFSRSLGMHDLVSTKLGTQSYTSLYAANQQRLQTEVDAMMEDVRAIEERYK